eukprot:g1300.t1
MWNVIGSLLGDSTDDNSNSELTSEEIRKRRIARLQNSSTTELTKTSESRNETLQPSPRPSPNRPLTTITEGDKSSQTSPHKEGDVISSPVPSKRKAPAPASTPEHSICTATPPTSEERTLKRRHRSEEMYIHNALSRILRVRLPGDKTTASDTFKSSFHSFPTVSGVDLKQSKLSVANVGEVIFSHIRELAQQGDGNNRQVILYLHDCFTRCSKELSQNPKLEKSIVATRQELINWTCTVLLEPCVTGASLKAGVEGKLDILSAFESKAEGASTAAFVESIAMVVSEQNSSQALCLPIFKSLFQRLCPSYIQGGNVPSALSLGTPSSINSLRILCTPKLWAAIFAASDDFLHPQAAACPDSVDFGRWLGAAGRLAGANVEDATTLGRCFRITHLRDHDFAKQYFDGLRTRTKLQVDQSVFFLQQGQRNFQLNLHSLMRKLMRKDSGRERMMLWIKKAIQFNAGRTKSSETQFRFAALLRQEMDENIRYISGLKEYASDGFFLNLSVVLLMMCMPFCHPNKRRNEKNIDVDFFATKKSCTPYFPEGIDVFGGGDFALPLHSSAPSDTEKVESDFHFVCRLFFATARAFHLGPMQIVGSRLNVLRRLGVSSESIRELATVSLLHEDALLLCPAFVTDAIAFLNLLAEWLLSVAAQVPFVDANTNLCPSERSTIFPLPSEPSMTWKCLPSHLLEDIIDFVSFVGGDILHQNHSAAKLLDSGSSVHGIFTLMVGMISRPQYIHSPHLRAKIGDFFYDVCLTNAFKSAQKNSTQQNLRLHSDSINFTSLLDSDIHAASFMAPGLMKLYGDVEHTGFYDRGKHRLKITILMKYLWGDDVTTSPSSQMLTRSVHHRATFHEITKDISAFTGFINGLLNNVNGYLADAFEKLPLIRNTLLERINMELWLEKSAEEREQAEKNLKEWGNQVTSILEVTEQNFFFLVAFTTEIQKPFLVQKNIRTLLVSSLSSALERLVVHGLGLKIPTDRKGDEYNWRPRQLLAALLKIFVNFSGWKSGSKKEDHGFAESIAKAIKDQREALSVLVENLEAQLEQKQTMLAELLSLCPENRENEESGQAKKLTEEIYKLEKRANSLENDKSGIEKMFVNALKIARRTNPPLVENEYLQALELLTKEVSSLVDEMAAAQAEIPDDIPDEFCDLIFGELMDNPVVLPSNNIVDRDFIEQHLLTNPTDPFTRFPMSIEDVVPATELKERIDEWKAGRRNMSEGIN